MRITCIACGNEITLPEKVGFRDTCPSCDAWLHACVNCRFFVDGQCTEPSAEKARDPEGQNFCDWFREKKASAGGSREPGGRDAAEEMWKKLTRK